MSSICWPRRCYQLYQRRRRHLGRTGLAPTSPKEVARKAKGKEEEKDKEKELGPIEEAKVMDKEKAREEKARAKAKEDLPLAPRQVVQLALQMAKTFALVSTAPVAVGTTLLNQDSGALVDFMCADAASRDTAFMTAPSLGRQLLTD